MDDKNIKEDDGLDIEIIDDFILDEPSQKLDSNAQSLEMKKRKLSQIIKIHNLLDPKMNNRDRMLIHLNQSQCRVKVKRAPNRCRVMNQV